MSNGTRRSAIDDKSITLTDSVDGDYGRLGVLVNNAGMADRADGPSSNSSIDTYSTSTSSAQMVSRPCCRS
jgi:short-subunit dehydrogenase involved in D-alanine esterification of teichoic acids